MEDTAWEKIPWYFGAIAANGAGAMRGRQAGLTLLEPVQSGTRGAGGNHVW